MIYLDGSKYHILEVVKMLELLKVELKRYLELLERGEYTPEVKKLGATIRQHTLIYDKESK
jgi:hypothetical protein